MLFLTFFTHVYVLTHAHTHTCTFFLHNDTKVPQFLNSNSLMCSA